MTPPCAYCSRGDHYACRKDITPCGCSEPRCNQLPGTDEPEPFEEAPMERAYEREEAERHADLMEHVYEARTGG